MASGMPPRDSAPGCRLGHDVECVRGISESSWRSSAEFSWRGSGEPERTGAEAATVTASADDGEGVAREWGALVDARLLGVPALADWWCSRSSLSVAYDEARRGDVTGVVPWVASEQGATKIDRHRQIDRLYGYII